jgi:hypothetical protein
MNSLTRNVRVWFGPSVFVFSLVGVAATDQILVEHQRPEVSVPTVQAVGLHTEPRGVLRGVGMQTERPARRGEP